MAVKRNKPAVSNTAADKLMADLPVLRSARGQLLCGRRATRLGRCHSCGYKPTRYSEERHKGTCPKCGGIMRCLGAAMQNGRCKNHGGKAPRGIASPQWITGRRSKYLPAPLGAIYSECLEDKKLLSLRDDIAMLDARINELLQSLAEAEQHGAKWTDLVGLMAQMEQARKKNDPAAVASTLERLASAIKSGASREEIWGQVQSALSSRERLTQTEVKHMIQHRQMLSIEHAMALIHRIADIIKRNVHDPSALNAIALELGTLIAPHPEGQDSTPGPGGPEA